MKPKPRKTLHTPPPPAKWRWWLLELIAVIVPGYALVRFLSWLYS